MAQAINNWINAPAQAPMNQHLCDVCGIENNYLRNYLMREGFRLPNNVATKSLSSAATVCMNVHYAISRALDFYAKDNCELKY